MKRKSLFLAVGLLVLTLLFGGFESASALGVSPARTTVDFEPGLKKTVSVTIANTEGRDATLLLAAQGELGKYITSPRSEVTLKANEPSAEITYTVNLPEDLEPGLHTGEFLIINLPGDSKEGLEAQITATLAIATQLHVYVPYPGKHAAAELKVVSANEGEEVLFVFSVVSDGKFDLTNVFAQVDIYDFEDKKIDSFTTVPMAVTSGDKKELVHSWNAEFPIGDYRAVASLVYDEGTINLARSFSIGSSNLILRDIIARNFQLGEIAKLEMIVENKWPSVLPKVYVVTNIFNDIGEEVTSFESGAHDIEARSKYSFTSYWDTAGVLEGTYDAEILINQPKAVSRKSLRFEVSQNDLKILGLGYVISSGQPEGSGDSLVVILIVVIIVLVLVNLLWFMKLRKKATS